LADRYLDRVGRRSAAVGSVLCVGLDPAPDALPRSFPGTVEGIERFARLILDGALPYASAVKPNLAFFEAFGSAGLAALERLRAVIPGDVPVIMDAKRGDIGSTSTRQAVALFDALGADAVTVNPYLGEDAVAPLLERLDRFAYVLCRTSNPGAAELQGLTVAGDTLDGPGEPLWARVARRVATWGPGGTVGLVVGATVPDELAAVRTIAPELPFLVPGVGAQGGDIDAVLAHARATAGFAAGQPGGGLVVNVSRGIAGAAFGGDEEGAEDPGERIAAAAADWARRLPVLP
jgi:orotidine-5'-phosphate decarboxylase